MAIQTSFQIDHNKAYAGMIADNQVKNIVTGLNTTAATIPYGSAVFATTGDEIAPTGAIGMFKGILVREVNRAFGEGETFGLPVNRDGSVLTDGVIYITAPVAVTKYAPAFIGADGKFALTGAEGVQPVGKFVDAGAKDELVRISLKIGG